MEARDAQRGREGARLHPFAKAVYGLGDHAVNVGFAALAWHYYAFLTQEAALRPLLAGLVFWVGRVVDAVTDPLMGRLSDHTRWRRGRRRPYFLLGALPLGLAFALLWSDPPAGSQGVRFAYYALAYVFFSVAVTVVSVPYLALIPEMALDYHERTSLNGYRAAGSMAGAFVAVQLGALAGLFGGGSSGFAAAGAAMAVWITLPWIAVYRVSYEQPGFQRPSQVGFLQGMRTLLQHRSYRILAGIFLCSRIALDLVMAHMILYFEHWLNRRGDFEWTMTLLLAGVVASLPLWLNVSRRTDKRTLFLMGTGVWIAAQLAFLAATPDWSRGLVAMVALLAGMGYGAIEMMPWSMLGDVVDEDELTTGERREGIYAGSFMFLRKLGGPTAFLLAGVALDATGFRAGAPAPEASVQAIRLLTGLAPLGFIVLAMALARRYPLSHAAHTQVVRQIEARRGSR